MLEKNQNLKHGMFYVYIYKKEIHWSDSSSPSKIHILNIDYRKVLHSLVLAINQNAVKRSNDVHGMLVFLQNPPVGYPRVICVRENKKTFVS